MNVCLWEGLCSMLQDHDQHMRVECCHCMQRQHLSRLQKHICTKNIVHIDVWTEVKNSDSDIACRTRVDSKMNAVLRHEAWNVLEDLYLAGRLGEV